MSLKGNRLPKHGQNLTQLDAFERVRRLFSLIMLPTGALACLLAWAMELSAQHVVAFDFYFLPLFGLALGLSAALVWRKPITLPWIERTGFVVLSVYLLVTLQTQLHGFLPVYGHFNEFTYWFFVAFLIAFIGWKPRNALYLCAGLYAIMLLLLALNLPPLLKLEGHRFWLTINYVAQFYFACLIYISVHYALAQLRPQLSAMQRLALTDPLTGVANRRRGEELLSLELARAGRYVIRCRWFCSTWIISNASTTSTGMPWATLCCAPSRASSATSCASPTTWPAGAARSSWLSLLNWGALGPCRSPNGCASRSPGCASLAIRRRIRRPVSASPSIAPAIHRTASCSAPTRLSTPPRTGGATGSNRKPLRPRCAPKPGSRQWKPPELSPRSDSPPASFPESRTRDDDVARTYAPTGSMIIFAPAGTLGYDAALFRGEAIMRGDLRCALC